VHVYRVARRPAEDNAGPLAAFELKGVGMVVRERVGVPVNVIIPGDVMSARPPIA
jgi:hypothetical protein